MDPSQEGGRDDLNLSDPAVFPNCEHGCAMGDCLILECTNVDWQLFSLLSFGPVNDGPASLGLNPVSGDPELPAHSNGREVNPLDPAFVQTAEEPPLTPSATLTPSTTVNDITVPTSVHEAFRPPLPYDLDHGAMMAGATVVAPTEDGHTLNMPDELDVLPPIGPPHLLHLSTLQAPAAGQREAPPSHTLCRWDACDELIPRGDEVAIRAHLDTHVNAGPDDPVRCKWKACKRHTYLRRDVPYTGSTIFQHFHHHVQKAVTCPDCGGTYHSDFSYKRHRQPKRDKDGGKPPRDYRPACAKKAGKGKSATSEKSRGKKRARDDDEDEEEHLPVAGPSQPFKRFRGPDDDDFGAGPSSGFGVSFGLGAPLGA